MVARALGTLRVAEAVLGPRAAEGRMTEYVTGKVLAGTARPGGGEDDDEAEERSETGTGTDAASHQEAEIDPRRAELIGAAQSGWIDALTDLGGRNTLLYYKDRRAGTLDL